MRTKTVLKNIISNFCNNFVVYILRFFSRTIFIKTIGEIYLGVNGLLSNVLGLLALAELGISTAIGYNLYKPLGNNDIKKISSLMKFYKKAYRWIALIVAVLGMILLPFLPFFIKDSGSISNLSYIYLIYLGNMVISYLFSYKRVLIISDQKNYKITPIIIATTVLQNILQIIVLIVFKNYILYLLIQTLTTILENIFVNKYIEKQYKYLKDIDSAEKLNKVEFADIKNRVKGIFIHKIGYYVLTSTDNLVISKIIGIVYVGLLSNYVLLKNTVKSFLDLIISNMTSSVGNLIAVENNEKNERIFNELNLFSFLVYSVTTICFINLFNPFISIWLGEEYLFSQLIVYVISINYFLSGMVGIVELFKGAAGLYYNDKIVPIIQATINILVSVALAFKLGVLGVMIGTLVSYVVPFIVKPIIVYKHVFNQSSKRYFVWFFKKSVIFAIMILVTSFVVGKVTIFDKYINLGLNLIISIFLPTLILFILYRNSREFKDLVSRFKLIFNRK